MQNTGIASTYGDVKPQIPKLDILLQVIVLYLVDCHYIPLC
jgi:hypothetical protein